MIIEANCEEGIFFPIKVSDFIQSNIPIFAVSPSIGVLNDLYIKGIVNYFASVASPDSIMKALNKIYQDHKDNKINSLLLTKHLAYTEENVVMHIKLYEPLLMFT